MSRIQSYFGVGIIGESKSIVSYSVKSIKDLTNVIIPHFNKYPLITKKRQDFELFKLGLDIINKKEHTTKEGLAKLVAIKSSMNNLTIPHELKGSFPDIARVENPSLEVEADININPYLLVGFIEAEGCFLIEVSKSVTNKFGFRVKLNFSIAQHSRDFYLMNRIVNYFDCGVYVSHSTRAYGEFRIVALDKILGIIIPFFYKYPLQGSKYFNFQYFCDCAYLMKDKAHLTPQGLEKIKSIKALMNKR